MKKFVSSLTVAGFAVAAFILATPTANAGTSEIVAAVTNQIEQSADVTPELKTFAKDKLIPLCTNEAFTKAVADQNAKGTSLEEIKKIDAVWQAAEEPLPIHSELTENACAAEVKKIVAANPTIIEMFVMDNQGANVGQNTITSDYWQGDEAKWEKSYNAGQGGVDISAPKLDKSTNRTDQKVSLPIIDASGKVIGAVCVGVAL